MKQTKTIPSEQTRHKSRAITRNSNRISKTNCPFANHCWLWYDSIGRKMSWFLSPSIKYTKKTCFFNSNCAKTIQKIYVVIQCYGKSCMFFFQEFNKFFWGSCILISILFASGYGFIACFCHNEELGFFPLLSYYSGYHLSETVYQFDSMERTMKVFWCLCVFCYKFICLLFNSLKSSKISINIDTMGGFWKNDYFYDFHLIANFNRNNSVKNSNK